MVGGSAATYKVALLFYFSSLLTVSLKEEKKAPPPVPKKPAKSKPAVSRDKASDAGDRQRQEARKRLLAAKRAASVRQNSATESADSIEIYVPEAQTRLRDQEANNFKSLNKKNHKLNANGTKFSQPLVWLFCLETLSQLSN